MISNEEVCSIENDVLAKCEKKYVNFSVEEIIDDNPEPSTFGYSYEIPQEQLHAKENSVKASMVGTFAEINTAIENAKKDDKKAATENYNKYKVASDTIETFIKRRMAKELGYEKDSKVFDEIYALGYEDGHASGWSDIFYYVEKYANFISKVATITGVNFK